MCNATWVCFDCRLAQRRPSWRQIAYLRPWLFGSHVGAVRCSKCQQSCHFLGPAIEIPPKRDVAGWNRLRERVCHHHIEAVGKRFKAGVRSKHYLEQRVLEIERRPANHNRNELLKKLRDELMAGPDLPKCWTVRS